MYVYVRAVRYNRVWWLVRPRSRARAGKNVSRKSEPASQLVPGLGEVHRRIRMQQRLIPTYQFLFNCDGYTCPRRRRRTCFRSRRALWLDGKRYASALVTNIGRAIIRVGVGSSRMRRRVLQNLPGGGTARLCHSQLLLLIPVATT